MATIAEMFVEVGADVTEFQKGTQNMQREMDGLQNEMKTLAAGLGTSANQINDDWRSMSQGMKEAIDSIDTNLEPVKIDVDTSEFDRATNKMQTSMKDLQSDMRTMATSTGTSVAGMSRDWQHMSKEMQDAFKASSDKLKPFKAQQQEIQYEFFKMSQGMKDYKGSTSDFMDGLEEMGKRQKKVTDEMMKNNDMMKMGFITGIATMLARSTQSEKIASNLDRMNNPLYNVNKSFLAITGNMEKMAKAGAPAQLALSLLGPTANMKELNDMMMLINTGLMRYQMVALGALVANVMLFSGLHKAAADSVPGYIEAFDKMGGAVREAFQPMVDVFAAVMVPIYNLITYIAELTIKFNEAHPILAKIIQGFLLLIPVLILLLAPLAIGIGLFAGMQAAFASTWMLIGPLITGLGAMMGTVLLVAAAIAILGAALYLLWTKNEGFRDGVIKIWNAIKEAAAKTWDWIYTNAIKPAIDAIVKFVTEQMNKVKEFWKTNGKMIQDAGKNVWDAVSGVIKIALGIILEVMKFIWPIVKALVISTWDAIKLGIEGAINIILGVITFFAAMFTGDWSKMWEAVKQILTGAVQVLLSFLQLSFFGGILKGVGAFAKVFGSKFKVIWDDVAEFFTGGVTKVQGIVTKGFDDVVSFITGLGKTFFNAGKGLIEMMAKGIESAAGAVIGAVKGLAQKARDFLPFSPAKTGPLSDLNHLDFGGPIADSINSAIPKVRGLMSNLLAMPALGVEGNGSVAGDQYGDIIIQIPLSDIEQVKTVYDIFDTIKQAKRARG